MRRILFVMLVLSGFSFLCGPVQADLYDGLVAYYQFDGNADDESDNGNDGTVNGAALTEDRFGNADSAYSFDGSNDYISVDYVSDFDSEEFTAAAWFYCSSILSAPQTIIGHGEDNSDKLHFRMFVYKSTGELMGDIEDSSNSNYTVRSNLDVADSEWHFGVVTRDSNGTLSLYLDGELIDSRTTPSSPSVDSDLTIGALSNGNGLQHYYGGLIDDIRFYNRALSEDEIQELYTESDSDDCGDYDDGYDDGYKEGMQYCIDNPEACGIDTGDSGECEDCDLNGDGKVNGQDLSTWVDGCLGAKPE